VDRGIIGWAAIDYGDAAARLINVFKEQGRTGLATVLCQLAEHCEIPKGVTLVGLPSSARSIRQRGYVPAVLIAKTLARSRGLESQDLMRFANSVQDQAGLSREQRAKNLEGSMRVRGKPDGVVWLVDDVVTTGASMREAARALAEAGCTVGGFLAIAETVAKNDEGSTN
jgi:predicted amidophosphoribosyltransferase